MKRAEFLSQLKTRFPDQELALDPVREDGLTLKAERLLEVLKTLRDEPDFAMNYLDFITCADFPPEHMNVVYSLYSLTHRHRLGLKVQLNRDHPSLESATPVWQNADWNEREIYDLYGVVFHNHPDPRRIMMPEDWEGHPLRKDYLHPNLQSKPD